jgi:hypothetical protein
MGMLPRGIRPDAEQAKFRVHLPNAEQSAVRLQERGRARSAARRIRYRNRFPAAGNEDRLSRSSGSVDPDLATGFGRNCDRGPDRQR